MRNRPYLILLLAFGGLMASCSGAATTMAVVSTTTVPPITTSTTAAPAPSSTTTTTEPPRPVMVKTAEYDGITDDRLLVHLVPEQLDEEPRPLVVVLHAYAGLALSAIPPDIEAAATAEGWIVLAPSGMVDSAGNQYWSATPTCCDRDNRRNDDVGYLRELIEAAIVQYPIDRSRVVVVGGSNGGFMAYQLACQASDLVTAIVVTAATEANSDRACQPRFAVSVLHVHGRQDQAVKFEGDELSVLLERIAPYPSAEETVGRWAKRNGCPTELPTSLFRVRAVRGSWLNCSLGTSVEFAWLDQGHNVQAPPWLAAEVLDFIGRPRRDPPRPLA